MCHDYKTNLSIIHLKDAAQLFAKELLNFSFIKKKNDCKSTKDDSSPLHDGEEVVAAGVVTVQGKYFSRMQNISSHKMPECKVCMRMDNLWKEKTTISHWGESCSPGDGGHTDSLVHDDLCTLALVADREMKAIAPLSASSHSWCTSTSQELQAAISILETEPLGCFPGGGTVPTQVQKECFMLTLLGRPGGIWP